NREAVDAVITEWTSKRTKHEVTRIIAGAGVPCGAVLTTLELLHDPDLHKRGMMQKIDHPVRGPVIVPGWPLRMSDSQVPLKCAPVLGADSEAIYGEWLGCSPDEVKDMPQSKAIRGPPSPPPEQPLPPRTPRTAVPPITCPRPGSLGFQRLYDFVQVLERLCVFGAYRLLTLAPWIGPLQRAEHGPRHRDRSASVILFADKIELR